VALEGEHSKNAAAVLLMLPNIVMSVKIEPAADEKFSRAARIGKS